MSGNRNNPEDFDKLELWGELGAIVFGSQEGGINGSDAAYVRCSRSSPRSRGQLPARTRARLCAGSACACCGAQASGAPPPGHFVQRWFDSSMVKGTLPYLGLDRPPKWAYPPIAGALGLACLADGSGQASRLLRLMVAAVLVGASGIYWVDVLNPVDPAHARVYSYDLLWPPLLLWVGLCFFESCYAIARCARASGGCGRTARSLWRRPSGRSDRPCPLLTRSSSHGGYVSSFFLPLSTGLGVWLASGTLLPARTVVPFKLRLALAAAAAAIGLWIAGNWTSGDLGSVALWLVWPGFSDRVGMHDLGALWKIQLAEPAHGKPPLRTRQGLAFEAPSHRRHPQRWSTSALDPLVPLIIFIVAWTVGGRKSASGLSPRRGR